MKKWRLVLFLSVVIFSGTQFIHSCKKNSEDIPGKTPLIFTIPPGFPAPVYDFSRNPLTEEGFQLGRTLFYDGILSVDGHYPCASCHQQIAVFGTYDHDLSHGYNDQHTNRNAPGLFNLAWTKEFHYDGEFNSLESECLDPIQAPNEMAEEIGRVMLKLRKEEKYRELFKEAFGSTDITIERLQKALAQFTVSMVTANSKYDQVKRGVASFNEFEARGYAIFQAKCNSCHTEPMFTDYSFRNNGLSVNPMLQDDGRKRVTGKDEDYLKFRVPSLRNVSITYPYMHDGRYQSLRACVEHYMNNVQPGPTLDPQLSTPMSLTNNEINDLVWFLRALTDSVLVNNPRYAKPG